MVCVCVCQTLEVQTGVFSLLLHGFNGRYWVALSCLCCVSHDAFQQLH